MSLSTPPAAPSLPLIAGQRLDQVSFHARYAAMPPGIRAELIGGVVLMASPVGREHSPATDATTVWLRYYEENTPGTEALANASTALGPAGEVQPDNLLRILPERGGRTWNEGGIVGGGPELVVEVAHSSRPLDLGDKLLAYQQAGVLEYVVRTIEPHAVRWHRLDATTNQMTLVEPDADGLYRSTAFPGLWLDPATLLADDARRLRAVVDQGTATADHAAFILKLAGKIPGEP